MSIAETLPVADRVSIMVREAGLKLIRQADGARARTLCPFHSEKTPSCYVNEKSGLWNCFSCGKGGDFLTFVSYHAGIDRKAQFPQLLKYIDERYGTTLYQERGPGSTQEIVDRYLCNEYACNYYHETLLQILRDPAPHPLKQHLEKRKLNLETLKKYRVGYGGDSWTHLQKHLTGVTLGGKKLTADHLELLHLAFKPDESSPPVDRFAKRIIFPITQHGRILTFAGREIQEHGARYLNGKESPIFHKSDCLFGFDEVLPAIREAGAVVLVEGYFDVLAMHQLGFPNVVALMGTNLTTNQLNQLRNVTDKFVLFMDCDPAGRTATVERILPVVMTENIECRVVDLSSDEKMDAGRLLEEFEDCADLMMRHGQFRVESFVLNYCFTEGPQDQNELRDFCICTFGKIFRNHPDPGKQHQICLKLSAVTGLDHNIIARFIADDRMFEKLCKKVERNAATRSVA